ncbi:hypothetical protein K438DRAFT_102106 [Mycena galopus ATCC 62051]|nr:hypothetical protein K438DRAFT_102106 [Mycena galopus ATCC 62051]
MDASSSNHTFSTGQSIDVSTSPGTRYYTLLNTNEPAEGSDLTFIHSLISNTDARLAFLDHEIPNLQEKLSKLQKTLKQLEDERASLSSYQTRIRATLSPLRRMPPEVLAEIFMWTLSSIGDALTGGRFHVARSPWLLTQISSRWRAVSLATPSLWSRVVMDYSEGATRLPYYSLALVETQIQRAHKLKIHFYGCSTLPDSRPQIQIFEFLLQHSSRWEELSLGLTCAIVPLLTALRDRVPALKRLWIQWEDDPDRRPSVQTIDCFQSAPSLVDFGFSQSIPVPVSIHQLTRYQVEGSWETQKGILNFR